MMTVEEFQSLEPGDEVEVGPLFAGLSSEPVTLTVTHPRFDAVTRVFTARWHNVTLGQWTAHLDAKEGKIRWELT